MGHSGRAASKDCHGNEYESEGDEISRIEIVTGRCTYSLHGEANEIRWFSFSSLYPVSSYSTAERDEEPTVNIFRKLIKFKGNGQQSNSYYYLLPATTSP
jgi:hypothetical protein